jgi:CRP-like cAMP-binding protein
MNEDNRGLRGRMARQGEEALGKVAQELLEHPMVSRALSATFEARERATRAQELAMSALNLPSAGDLERLTRRLRSVSQRLETIEGGLDRLEQRIDQLGSSSAIDKRLTAIEELLARLEAGVAEPAAMPAAVAAETPGAPRTRQTRSSSAAGSRAGQKSRAAQKTGAGQEPGAGQG